MTVLRLERFTPLSDEMTLGTLWIEGDPANRVFTLERPWRDNLPRVSCVPDGEYVLVPHSSEKFPDTWALVGETVSHYGDPSKARSAILIHPANDVAELQGCIAPGTHITWITSRLGVSQSRVAMDKVRRWLRPPADSRRLVIESKPKETQ